MQDAYETKRNPVQAGILALLAAFACVFALRVQAESDAGRVQLDIEAGNAAVKLNEWAKKTQFNVLNSFDQTSRLRTKAVVGMYEPVEALRLMLADTGLEFTFVNPRFVSVYLPADAKLPVRTPPRAPAKPSQRRASLPVVEGFQSLEEVLVTGTNIRDIEQVGLPRLSFTQVDFEAIGAISIVDAIRTMPQVFGGGPTEDTELGLEAGSNSGRGRGINLRGLDAGSTLALINGRRLAPGGSEGLFIDITSIPLIAIKQLDIVTDSASALYGSDAVGGVINFVMRENIDGAETQLRAGGLGDSPGSVQFGQLFGRQWDGGSGLMAFEYYERDALAAAERDQVTSDLTRFGGQDFRTFNSNPGTIVFGPLTFAIPAGQDGSGLTVADLVPNTQNKSDKWTGADILPEQERWSAYGNLRHTLTDNVDVFVDALLTDRRAFGRTAAANQVLPVPCSNAFFPAGLCPPAPGPQFVPVGYSFGADLGPVVGDVDVITGSVAAGLNRTIGMDWSISGTAGYSLEQQHLLVRNTLDVAALLTALGSSDPTKAFNPFGDGSHTSRTVIDDIRSQQEMRTHSTVTSFNVTASGPLFAMPAGDVKFAVGGDVRNQAFESNVRVGDGPLNRVYNDRDVQALFGELYIPLVGEPNERRGLRKLELSLAARLENYSDFGEATTPRIGLAWTPLAGLSLRGSWATSLRAPNLYDLNEVNNVVTQLPIPTPGTPPGAAIVLLQSGKNADLHEERAESWTFGADFRPETLSDLAFAVTYFNVEFRDRIGALNFQEHNWLSDPLVADRVTFAPTQEQIRAACESGLFASALASSSGPCGSIPVSAIIDVRKNNGWFLRTSGLDFSVKYNLDSRAGEFRFGLLGTYVLDYSEALLEGSPLVSMKGTQNNPVDLRLRGTTSWRRGRLSATGAANFTDSYRDTVSMRHVGSWTTLDFGVAYTLGREGTETRFALNVENVFDEMPPFLNNPIGLGYDAENGDIFGRTLSFQLRKNW